MNPFDTLLLFYFTGTGNALAAAGWIINYASLQGMETRLINIADKPSLQQIHIQENTLIGFCYPTHGFNAPPIVLRFLKNFPKSKSRNKVFVLNTRAGMKMSKLFTPGLSGLAQILPAILMRVKGYRLIGYRPLDLPSNWISIHPGLKQSVVDSIFLRCKQITKQFAAKILKGKKEYRGLYDLPIDLFISPVALAYYLYGRFILSKTFIATNACNHCGLCVKNCPVEAIEMIHQKPFWSYRCESCMHCMNYCPQRAIETPHGFTLISWWLAYTLLPAIVLYVAHKYDFGGISENTSLDIFIQYFTEIVLGTALVFGAYKLLHTLLRFSLVDKLLKISSLTRFSWWRRYRSPKNP